MATMIVRGVVRNGRVELSRPLALPDGAEVEVHAPDSDAPMTEEEIATALARMDAMEPVEWTDEERAAWEAERQARKEWEKATFFERGERSRRIWDE